MTHAIKPEWIFLQHATWYTGDAFARVEKILLENVLPRLLFKKTKTLLPIVGSLSMIPVKKVVLGLLNPVMSEKEKYVSSQRGSAELIWYMTDGGSLSYTNHLPSLGEERRDGQKDRDDEN